MEKRRKVLVWRGRKGKRGRGREASEREKAFEDVRAGFAATGRLTEQLFRHGGTEGGAAPEQERSRVLR